MQKIFLRIWKGRNILLEEVKHKVNILDAVIVICVLIALLITFLKKLKWWDTIVEGFEEIKHALEAEA